MRRTRLARLAASVVALFGGSACGGGTTNKVASAPTTSTVRGPVTTIPPAAPTAPAPAAVTSSAGWSAALHDAAHSGTAGTTGPQSGALRWTRNLGGPIAGGPAIGPDGTIYATAGRYLIAVKDKGGHGQILWRFAAGSDIEVSASVAPDGTVILGTNDPFEYGVSPQGRVKWRYPRQIFSYSTPAATPDGLAYFGDNAGYVDVVTAATGESLGRYDGTAKALSSVGLGVWTAPLVDSSHDVYFGTASGHVFGYSWNGTKLFDLATGATVDSYPALTSAGTLLIGSDNGNLYAIG